MPSPVLCLADTTWHERHRRLFQVMSTLAASRRVYVLERAVRPCRLSLLGAARAGEVTVLTAYLPDGGDRRAQCRGIAPLLEAVLDTEGVLAPLVWVRDAEALPVVERLATLGTVYDYPARSACPRPTRAERQALRHADVVLAASVAQADWLRRWHPRVLHAPTPAVPGRPRGPAQIAAAVERLIDERGQAGSAASRPLVGGAPIQPRSTPAPHPPGPSPR